MPDALFFTAKSQKCYREDEKSSPKGAFQMNIKLCLFLCNSLDCKECANHKNCTDGKCDVPLRNKACDDVGYK